MGRAFIVDVSGYQPNATRVDWWQTMIRNGVAGGIVKLSESLGYRNPYGAAQINAIKMAGIKVSGYHFSRFVGNSGQAVAEANYAVATAHAIGLPSGSPLVLDYEERKGSRGSNTQACIAFLNTVKNAGFVPVFYSYSGMANLWDFGAIHNATGAVLWIAAYPHRGASYNADFGYFPSISNYTTAWQFTDNFKGFGVDGSVDLTGVFTTAQKVTNGGSLDGLTFSGDKFTVNGWFASDKAQGKNNAYVIITNDKITEEYARQKVTLTNRPDVAKAYPDIPNGGKSGFSATFNYDKRMAGKKLAVIFRYTDDPSGNGHAVDYSSVVDMTKSVANLDSINTVIYSNKLQVNGWFASDMACGLKNRFLILYDTNAKRELERLAIKGSERDDVTRAYPSIYGTNQSGFSGQFDYSASLVGRKLQVIARYSDDEHGESNHVDYWFNPFNGPAMPVIDGKYETTVLAHSFNATNAKDGLISLTFK